MTRAHELGIQAKNDTLTAVDRRAISFEIGQIRESMMSLPTVGMQMVITCLQAFDRTPSLLLAMSPVRLNLPVIGACTRCKFPIPSE